MERTEQFKKNRKKVIIRKARKKWIMIVGIILIVLASILAQWNAQMHDREVETLNEQIEQKDSLLKISEVRNISLKNKVKTQKANFEVQLIKKDSIVSIRETESRRKDWKITELKNEVEFQDIAINTLLNEKETLRTKLSNEQQKAIDQSDAAHEKYVKLVKKATRDSVLLSDLKKEHRELASIATRNDELFWGLQEKRPWTKSWFSSPESTTVETKFSYFMISKWKTTEKGERRLKGRVKTEKEWKKESDKHLNSK